MRGIPASLSDALAPISIIAGHYGSGKTNLSMNLAIDLASCGRGATLIDLDIVNPYFRASEQRTLLEDAGVKLIAPVFSEAHTGLDVPSLTGAITPALEHASEERIVIVDLGGDDVGAGSLGRFSKTVAARDYALLYVLNRHRNQMATPEEAANNLAEIEMATHLQASALIDNAHLKDLTDERAVMDEEGYAQSVCDLTGLPLVAKTVPAAYFEGKRIPFAHTNIESLVYPIRIYVKNPWE